MTKLYSTFVEVSSRGMRDYFNSDTDSRYVLHDATFYLSMDAANFDPLQDPSFWPALSEFNKKKDILASVITDSVLQREYGEVGEKKSKRTSLTHTYPHTSSSSSSSG